MHFVVKNLTIAATLFCSAVQAETLTSDNLSDATTQSYVVVNEDIKDFLRDLGRDNGVRILASQRVRGRLDGVSLNGTVTEILDKVSTRLELDWFTHNNVIYLSSRDEALTRMIRLGDLSMDDVLAELEDTALKFPAFSLSAAAENSALLVTGPPRYLALVESVIEGIPSEEPEIRTARARVIVVRRGIERTEEPIQ